MLESLKDGADCDDCSNDAATCGLAMNCCVYCGRAVARSARTAVARNMLAGWRIESNLIEAKLVCGGRWWLR